MAGRGRPRIQRQPLTKVQVMIESRLIREIDRIAVDEHEGVRARAVRALCREAVAARAAGQ